MLRIHLVTGGFSTRFIDVEGNMKSDISQLIDDYYLENGKELPVYLFDVEEIEADELEVYIPINGGEKYIMGISHVEEIEGKVNFKKEEV